MSQPQESNHREREHDGTDDAADGEQTAIGPWVPISEGQHDGFVVRDHDGGDVPARSGRLQGRW